MKLILLIATLTALVLPSAKAAASAAPVEEDGVAFAIVYDTSGSMAETVRDAQGKQTPKFRIANRALAAIANRIQAFAADTNAGPRKIHAGLFVFSESGGRTALPFGPFDGAALTNWAKNFSTPGGGTPLGNALTPACRAVLNSGLTRKHVLVITDGMNTVGPQPTVTLPPLLKEADRKQTLLGVHFVAFDVDAKVFDGVKKLGATVLGAADETQLNTQLEFILETKILLEAEEPAKK